MNDLLAIKQLNEVSLSEGIIGLVEHSGAQSQHGIQTSKDPAGEEGYSKRHARRILLLTTAGVTDGGRNKPEACPALLD